MYKPANKIPHRHSAHGDQRSDDYFWMRERDSEPVLEYLKQENLRVVEALKPAASLETKLYHEMRSRIKEDDSSVPVLDTGYYYYSRYQTGAEYEIHCRKKGSERAAEEIILDENQLAEGLSFCDVGGVVISPDQRYMAFAVDSVGRRIYDIHFKDLQTGQTLPDKIEAVTANIQWAADNQTVFYVRQDPETLRSYQVFRYRLGSAKPELVYEEKDTTYSLGISATKRGELLFMPIYKSDTTEWRILDARQPESAWRVFWAREDGHEYDLIDGGDRFYILTNWQAHNFRVMEADFSAVHKKDWREVIPASDKLYFESFDAYQDFLVVSERENGLTQIRLRERASGKDRWLKFPDPVYEVAAYGLPDYQSAFVRFRYESLIQPPSVYDEQVAAQKRELRKVREVPGYQRDNYESRRLWSKAADGTMVPMSVLMKKGTALNGQSPALLYGYGSYGLTTNISFRSSALSLVDRGFVFVLAHIRGGSEMGRGWYEDGKMRRKMNTFTDFISCAETLISEGYTSPQHLHIMGGSAGGLLMGAVINLRPDLFRGVIAAVPFVDVLTTMLDESIPLTTSEYREWGDPRINADYMYMKQYSPYDNVAAKNYPNILVTTGYHDSQVQYWEPAKWVAKLREKKTDDNLLLFYTELEAGHSGASGRFEALKTLAKEYAFILMLEGIKD
jgi:oligopeptidase B